MPKRILFTIVLGLITISAVVLAACSSQGTQSNAPISPTWIKPEVANNTVSIAANEVKTNKMTHFEVETSSGQLVFMAYDFGGKIQVRASICPPCRSESFSLYKDTLICDTCSTVFDAKTGDGIRGACVAFPKASVPYEVNGSQLVMKVADLVTASKNTLKPGWP